MRVAVLYEHPTWSVDLLARMVDHFGRRDVEVVGVPVGGALSEVPTGVDLWVNRINAMPSVPDAGRQAALTAAARHLLLGLEASGQRVFNPWTAHSVGLSKLAQGALFERVGLAVPRSILITSPDQAVQAADRVGYPVVTKPNVGGSGAGIVRWDERSALAAGVADGLVDLGVDGTGLVQQVIPSADGLVHRIEILDGELLYATDQPIVDGAFNYCAVDGCGTESHLVTPPGEMVEAARAVMEGAGADIGGVEYLVSADDGRPTFYDFNPYSNFVTGRDTELGFNPLDRYIQVVSGRLGTR